MDQVEIFHTQPIEWARITVNDHVVAECENSASVTGPVDHLPAEIRIEFRPFGIAPKVRYNGFLLNTWLADIKVYDHLLEFMVDQNFYQQYRDRDIQGRIDNISGDSGTNENLHDKYIGIHNLYPDLVSEIRDLLA